MKQCQEKLNLLNYDPIMYKIYNFYFLKKHTQQKVTNKKSQSVCMRCWRIKQQPLPALLVHWLWSFQAGLLSGTNSSQRRICIRMTSFPLTPAQAQRSFWKKKTSFVRMYFMNMYFVILEYVVVVFGHICQFVL